MYMFHAVEFESQGRKNIEICIGTISQVETYAANQANAYGAKFRVAKGVEQLDFLSGAFEGMVIRNLCNS